MHPRVIFAIFKRNFFAYFTNPTGYVFICGFVLLSGFAAFWPHEFFNANLANLDQLNKYLPYILLLFVPAITMSIWADERRQGTDELLLTLPASDLDVVAGKYKAAVAIYTVALLFSLSNVIALIRLGDPDGGLLFTTFIGYWLMGLAMLAVGMVASFLTPNVTVGFILGVAFNAPLVFANSADVIVPGSALVQSIREWSIPAKFADFTRGVISFASVIYFLSIMAVGLYLSLVLVGRRHWVTGGKGGSMFAHFIVRALSVIVIALGLSAFFSVKDVRVDASSEGLSSLSPETQKQLKSLGEKTVHIDAFLSPEGELPRAYVTTRINLINTLNEIQKSSGGRVTLTVHGNLQRYDPEAAVADQRYGITPRVVADFDRGEMSQATVFMGLAITSGFDREVIPFVDRGVPVEYELIRSIVSLSAEKKKTLGVVKTDASLMGDFNPMQPNASREEQFILELQKQYEVLEVDPLRPIERRYDVMLLVQPSSLEQQAMDNVVAAIQRGQPTAIFEDPTPLLGYKGGSAPPPPGTLDPRRPPRMDPMMARMGMQPPSAGPKGNLDTLWNAIGAKLNVYEKEVRVDREKIEKVKVIDTVAQDFNPFPKASSLDPEIIFVGKGGGELNASNAITSGLQFVLFPFPGMIQKTEGSKVTFTPLVTTGLTSGFVDSSELFSENPFGGRGFNEERTRTITEKPYVLAARLTGMPDEKAGPIDVVLVSDIDVFATWFFGHRDRGADDVMGFFFDVDNVTFAMNIIDVLADDTRFLDIRKRKRVHRTLTAFEKSTEQARKDTAKAVAAFSESFTGRIREEETKINDRLRELAKERISGQIDDRQYMIKRAAAEEQLGKVLTTTREQLKRERDSQVEKAEKDLELTIRQMQSREKQAAAFVPPVLPLLIGIVVFFWRKSRELQGAVQSRLR